jgi:GH15 family glucan-1,4-alpha-glucosidase
LVDLERKSIEVILENQKGNGAIIACPNFPTYHYSWLRDGSFTAWAMLREGYDESCRSFLRWVGGVVSAQEQRIRKLSNRPGEAVGGERWLPARYAADGSVVEDEWPNHQIDGYGAWLWCLAEYRRASGDEELCRELAPSIELTVEYLARTWQHPCFDCWEENGTQIHSSTLACVYGGLAALRAFHESPKAEGVASQVRAFLLQNTIDGRFRKHGGTDSVDASLLWLSLPFGVVEPGHPLMEETVRHIERRLLFLGGVNRYPEDTYYGGGRWLILSSWLGWYYARRGRTGEARELLDWVTAQADAEGNLPEQVSTDVIEPSMIAPWVRRWGPVARPLVWSHAMYLVLKSELATAEKASATLHREES